MARRSCRTRPPIHTSSPGIGNTVYDFSDIVYPQDVRNCTTCHDENDADTPQASNWRMVANRAACGTCHEDINFAAGGHPGGLTFSRRHAVPRLPRSQCDRQRRRGAHRHCAPGAARRAVGEVRLPGVVGHRSDGRDARDGRAAAHHYQGRRSDQQQYAVRHPGRGGTVPAIERGTARRPGLDGNRVQQRRQCEQLESTRSDYRGQRALPADSGDFRERRGDPARRRQERRPELHR